MIRIAILADSHADEGRRWDEHCRIMDWMGDDFDAREVDLVGHAGDVYEAGSTPIERTFVADWAQRVARKRPLVIVRGNHDAQRDIAYLSRLRSEHPIIADETPGVHYAAGVQIATLPWPRKSQLLQTLGRAVSPEESSATASDLLRDVLRGLAVELSAIEESHARAPRLLLAHAMVDGARTNHDQPLVGMDMAVSAQDLALSRAHFVAVGHVHAEQEWAADGIPIVYPGAPRHTEFGPPAPTGYVIAEFEDHGPLIRWYRVPTPARPMLILEAQYCIGAGVAGFLFTDCEILPDAEIRFRYKVAPEHLDAAKRGARELADRWKANGAHSVKLEDVADVKTRSRAPEISAARTLPEKLEAFWVAKNSVPEGAVKSRLLGMLQGLQNNNGG